MIKSLLIAMLVSSSAFANQVVFHDKELLNAFGGDTIKASRVETMCMDIGVDRAGCHTLTGIKTGHPNQAKAVEKCMAQQYAPPGWNLPDTNRYPPGSVGEEIGGLKHTNKECHSSGSCDWYTWTDNKRRVSRDRAANEGLDQALKRYGASNDVVTDVVARTKVDALTVGEGIQSIIQFEKMFGENRQKAPLTQFEVDLIINYFGQLGWDDPAAYSVDPNAMCTMDKPLCAVVGGGDMKNPHYNVKTADELKRMEEARKEEEAKKKASDEAKKKREEEEKKKNKNKTAEEEKDPDLDGLEVKEIGMMAGEPSKLPDGQVWVTPVDPEIALNQKTAMERCVEREVQKIEKNQGSSTEALDAQEAEDVKRQSAEDALRGGYCTESVFGKEFCQKFKNAQASVRVENFNVEQVDAKKGAIESFKMTGACNANVLGASFCKAAKARWIINPVVKDLDLTGSGSKFPKVPAITPKAPFTPDLKRHTFNPTPDIP